MASNKDRSKKGQGGSQSLRGTSIHHPTKSVTFSDKNEETPFPSSSTEAAQNHKHNTLSSSSSPNNSNNISYLNEDEAAEELYFLDDDDEDSDACKMSFRRIIDLPDHLIAKILSNLSLHDIFMASFVCKEFTRIINNENNEIWRKQCMHQLHVQLALQTNLLRMLPTFKRKLRAFYHAFSKVDCSRNIVLKDNGFTVHRHPVAQSTDAVRGKIGFSRGRHSWHVIWEGPLGTVAMVGIATKSADMRAQGYIPLLGQDGKSWGWNLVENNILHGGESLGNFPLANYRAVFQQNPTSITPTRYQVGERILVILDCEESTLSFGKENEFYGVAFYDLPKGVPLYPAISAVYGNTEITMIYLGPPVDD